MKSSASESSSGMSDWVTVGVVVSEISSSAISSSLDAESFLAFVETGGFSVLASVDALEFASLPRLLLAMLPLCPFGTGYEDKHQPSASTTHQ